MTLTERKGWVSFAVCNVLFWTVVVFWLPTAAFASLVWGWGQNLSGLLGMRAFLSAGTLFVPGLAVLGYLAGSGWTRFGNATLLVAVGTLSLALAAAFALFLYPEYPARGPHELIAIATVLPTVAIPAVSIALWRRLSMNPQAWLYCCAWAVVVFGGTVTVFRRDTEMALPISVREIQRWERTDIQDISNYFLRADGVTMKAAARYAAALGLSKSGGKLGCGPQTGPGLDPARNWLPPENAELWVVDKRVRQSDRERYPTGLSGCVTRVAWASMTLFMCDICDWGI